MPAAHCVHSSTFFATKNQKWRFSKYSSSGDKWKTTESFSICNFCLDFSRSFCSRQNHRARCEIKAGGTMQRSKAVVAMMSEPSLPLWLRCSYICNLYYRLHRPFLHNLNGYKHISVCAGLVRLHILKTGPLHRRPNETSSWCISSSKVAQLIFSLQVFGTGEVNKKGKTSNVSFTYVCVRQR